MTNITFRSTGHEEEQESGAIAMFGYGSRDLEDPECISFSCLVDTVVRSLEIVAIILLYLILCEHISLNNLVYILAPFTLTFLPASTASSVERNESDDSAKMSGYISQCWNGISKMRLCALLSIFGAKCALIYMYSKNFSNAVRAVGSLSALADIDDFRGDVATVTPQFFVISLVCISFIMIVKSAFLISKMIEKYDEKSSHLYTLSLSLVDTISISLYFLIYRVAYQQNEVMHSLRIMSRLPLMFFIFGLVRFIVSSCALPKPEDNYIVPCMCCFGFIQAIMTLLCMVSTLLATDGLLKGLKMICILAIVERFYLTICHSSLGKINRKETRLRDSEDPTPGRVSAPSPSTSSRQNTSVVQIADVESHQRLLSQQAFPTYSHQTKTSGSAASPAAYRSVKGKSATDSESHFPLDGGNDGTRMGTIKHSAEKSSDEREKQSEETAKCANNVQIMQVSLDEEQQTLNELQAQMPETRDLTPSNSHQAEDYSKFLSRCLAQEIALKTKNRKTSAPRKIPINRRLLR